MNVIAVRSILNEQPVGRCPCRSEGICRGTNQEIAPVASLLARASQICVWSVASRVVAGDLEYCRDVSAIWRWGVRLAHNFAAWLAKASAQKQANNDW